MDLYDHVQEDDLKQAAIIMASFIYERRHARRAAATKTIAGQMMLCC